MNQSKFSLADVITLLAALAFGFICFLGANFHTLGDTTRSIILALIITVSLSGTALGAKWLKRSKSNFKTSFIGEIILLVLFTGLVAYFTYSPFSHYFVVSEQRVEIKKKLIAGITQAENLFSEYEDYAKLRETLYDEKLTNAVTNQVSDHETFTNLGFSVNGDSGKQIKNKIFMMHADLFPSNFQQIKTADSTWLAKSTRIVNYWKPIGIVDVIKNIEQNSKKSCSELVQLSIIREIGELNDVPNFECDLQFDNVKKHFTTLGKATPLSIGMATIAWLLMLLSWITTKRDIKGKGASQTATYEVVL